MNLNGNRTIFILNNTFNRTFYILFEELFLFIYSYRRMHHIMDTEYYLLFYDKEKIYIYFFINIII